MASAKTLSSVIHLSIVDSLTLPVNEVIKKTTMNHFNIHVDINLVSSSIACAFVSWALVGLIFSPISPLLEKCAATATHHRLAQGWANACDTRVERVWLSSPNLMPEVCVHVS